MTKIDLYRCDRCGKNFKIPDYEVPAEISMRDQCRGGTVSEMEDATTTNQLCMDCESFVHFFMHYKTYGKRIDVLIDSIINEEEKETP